MKITRRALLGGSVVVLGSPLSRVALGEPETADLLDRVAQARAPVRTVHGPFVQTRTIGLLAANVHSRGTMTLVRPDRLRWQLDPPDDVTFWVRPEGLAYRSAHGQGNLPEAGARIAAALRDMRTLLGGDLHKLADRWSLRTLRDDAGGAEIEATSRDPKAASTRQMRFALAPDLVRPTRALLVETEHDRTTIEFGALTVNDAVPDGAMRPE